MVFGNQTDKASQSQTKQQEITREELKALKEKASKVEELKKEKAELQEKIEELKEKNENYLNRLQRLQADYENYKKRIDRANEEYKTYATENILKKLVTHYDDLKRTQEVIDNIKDADESVEKGIQMIIKNFEKLLNEEGVEPIECEGEKFDPYKHEVMLAKDDKSVPKNTVLEELEKGYMFKNKVLRPAKVMVSK
jgi:molecular chaperone GrpE